MELPWTLFVYVKNSLLFMKTWLGLVSSLFMPWLVSCFETYLWCMFVCIPYFAYGGHVVT